MMYLAYYSLAHYISYTFLKNKIVKSQRWGLNICCGKTDGGGVNADIMKHKELPNFKLIKNVYNLPFKDKEFDTVMCSHTIEHVDKPDEFYKELKRVGEKVTLLIPPLYDLAAVFCFKEHKWIFLSFKTKHEKLPKYVKLPFARRIQEKHGQKKNA
mgnify:FL=1|jgi:ubiquinone/menaquinone biosynthesis C-methylase UbiE